MIVYIHYTSSKGTHSNFMLNYTFLLQGCNIKFLKFLMYNHCTVHIHIALCKHLYYLWYIYTLYIHVVIIIAYLCHSSAHLLTMVVVVVALYNYGI